MLSFMDYRKFVFLCYYLVMLWRRLLLSIGMVGYDTRHVSYNVIIHLTGKSNRAFGEWHDPSVEQHLSIEPLNLSVPSRAASEYRALPRTSTIGSTSDGDTTCYLSFSVRSLRAQYRRSILSRLRER